MFEKLKNAFKKWTKKVTEEKVEEEQEVQKIKETKEKKKLEKQVKKEQKKKEKKEIGPKEFEKLTEEKLDEKIKEELEKKEIPIPTKFNVGTQKVELDLEKLEEIAKEKPDEKKSFFKKISSSISKSRISEEDFEKYSEDLELLLLENNIALEVTEKILEELKEKIVNQEFPKKELEEKISQALKEILEEVLVEPFNLIEKIKEKKEPYVVLFCGINGSGKTTTIAKFANLLQKKNLSCVLAAADTFRAAAIDQIKKHGEKLNIKVITHEYGSDPASVGFDAIQYAKKNKIKCVLIDTAGRMHTSKNLMAEIEKINRVCKPDTKIFVGESITGNDSVEQVKAFDEAVNLNGIILTKADIDEKGGTILSVGHVTKKPIFYLGTGQEYNKLEKFDKKDFIEKLGLD